MTYDENGVPRGWSTAAGNLFEYSVREEINAQLALMEVELSDEQIRELAWGVAVELDYKWIFELRQPIPPGFEPMGQKLV